MGILRFLLAISVVLAHSTTIGGIQLVAPDTAVQTFYVISGFYMALVLDSKYKEKSYKLFISNRLLRIYPIYWIVLSLTFFLIIISVFIGNSSSKIMLWKEITGHGFETFYLFLVAVFSNIFLFFQDWLIFLKYDNINEKLQFVSDFHGNKGVLYGLMLIPQAWTIGVELMFYLLAPFLVKRNNFILSIILFLSLTFRFIMYKNGFNYDPWTYRFFPFEISLFVIGIFSFRLYKKIKKNEISFTNFALPIVLFLTLSYQFFDSEIARYSYIIIISILIPFVFKKTKLNNFDKKIGDLSYPIYICHILIWLVLEKIPIPMLHNGLVLVVLSSIFGLLLNHFITEPIEIYRQNKVTFSRK